MEQKRNNDILSDHGRVRVGDLDHRHILRLECAGCGHGGMILAAYLQRRFRISVRIASLEKRFRCTKCKARGLAEWHIEERER